MIFCSIYFRVHISGWNINGLGLEVKGCKLMKIPPIIQGYSIYPVIKPYRYTLYRVSS